MSSVSDGSLAAQPVALLQVEGVLPVRVVARFQLLCRQVSLLIEAAQQLALLLGPRGLGHLRKTLKERKQGMLWMIDAQKCASVGFKLYAHKKNSHCHSGMYTKVKTQLHKLLKMPVCLWEQFRI